MVKSGRQLAAVMFTDMVGYTALMQEDEDKARNSRNRHREVLERIIKKNQGEIRQYFGDGTLSTFTSAIQAVKSALEIQVIFQSEPKIPVRVGLHIGDVVCEEEGIYGDAVNVSSRVESVSIPGGVLFSGKVYDEIKNHPEFHSLFLGEYRFKNVKLPIGIYALTNNGLTVPTVKELKEKVPPVIKSIAVLPFVNMSGDIENEYFSDGMTEELINAFTRVEGLDVTARTSSFAFKGKNLDIREIGKQLNVDTILEGSVRKVGTRVRITAQLIDTVEGYHIFSETYNRELEDIFALQDEIALKISKKLTLELSGKGKEKHLVKTYTENFPVYNLYLKGVFYWNKWTPEDIRKGIGIFEEVLEMEPGFAPAYSWLANSYVVLGAMGTLRPGISYPRAQEYALKALELDDELYNSHISIGLVKMFYDWDWEGAYSSIQRALELNPGAGQVHYVLGMYHQAMGRMKEAVKELEQAVRLDPFSIPINNHLSYCYYGNGELAEAMIQVEKTLELDPGHRGAIEMKGWAYLALKETEKAIEQFEYYHSLTPMDFTGITGLGFSYAIAGRREEALLCLEKMKRRAERGEEEQLDQDLVMLYFGLGEYDQAFYHLDKALESRLGGMLFFRTNPLMEELRQDERYQELMKKYRLP